MSDFLFRLNRNPVLVALAWAFFIWRCFADWETMRWAVVGMVGALAILQVARFAFYVADRKGAGR